MGDSPLAGGIRGTASTSLAAHFRLLRLAPGACWPDGLSTVRWTDVIPFLKQAGQAATASYPSLDCKFLALRN